MGELSIFVDESGGQGGHSKYYILTLVFHDQSRSIVESLERHRLGLLARDLANIPFHAGPLMTGHDEYEGLDLTIRKAHLNLFFRDFQHLPITYHTFLYRRSEFASPGALAARMRRDITNLMFDHLDYFQSFEAVKIYYDDGQEIVAHALHAAVEYVISRGAVLYRKTQAADFMLSQVADLLCTLELTAQKYQANEATRTDEKFFGSRRDFKRNYLKFIKRKRLGG